MFAPGRRRIKVTRCTGDKEDSMLQNARVATRLPAQDLDRARAFYSEKLGLEPVEERPGGLLYRCGEGRVRAVRVGRRVVGRPHPDGIRGRRHRGERAVWFRDSEGNLMGMGQAIP
jgi:catechol 2,3-dioxygenase-like lactoylglutathione lyase family enzyme